MKAAERAVAGLLLALAVALHIVQFLHGGGLWRDEAAAVQLASLPSVREVAANFEHEAFPLAFPLALRAYMGTVGSDDMRLRLFGLAMGLSILATLWWNAAVVGSTVPIVSLALLTFNPTTIRFGDSVRGYGMGTVLILLAFGSVGRVVAQPTAARLAVAFAVSVLSVQSLLHNSALLFGIGTAGAVVCLVNGRWCAAMMLIAIGAVAAASMLPYVPALVRGRDWDILVERDVYLLPGLARTFAETSYVWMGLVTGALAAGVWTLVRHGAQCAAEWRAQLLYCALTLVLATGAQAIFFRVVHHALQPWYLIAVMGVVASTLDLLIEGSLRSQPWRLARLLFVAVFSTALIAPSWSFAHLRKSNMDLVVHRLATLGSKDDLVVVSPWFYGPSFQRYYDRREAELPPWVTLPEISDHRFHRYDLVKARMQSADGIGDLLARIRQTLQSGHRVHVVGKVRFPDAGGDTSPLPPAPRSRWGWDVITYENRWELMLGEFINRHVPTRGVEDVTAGLAIDPLEHVPLLTLEGWR